MIYIDSSLLKIFSSISGFIGTLILIKYGISDTIDTGGHNVLALSQVNEHEKQKIIIYRRWSKLGLVMIALSFILQIIEEVI